MTLPRRLPFFLLQPGVFIGGRSRNFLCITVSDDSVDPNTVWCIDRKKKRLSGSFDSATLWIDGRQKTPLEKVFVTCDPPAT